MQTRHPILGFAAANATLIHVHDVMELLIGVDINVELAVGLSVQVT